MTLVNIMSFIVPLSSLRLCVPPLRLLSAFMWQVAEQRRVKYYNRLEEFVSVVLEMVPDLLSAKERAELLLGLRARVRESRACQCYIVSDIKQHCPKFLTPKLVCL